VVFRESLCANRLVIVNCKIRVTSGDRSFTVSPTTCLEKGVTYQLRLTFQRYRNDRFTPEANILVDSVSRQPVLTMLYDDENLSSLMWMFDPETSSDLTK
jgi:hypothetical protein